MRLFLSPNAQDFTADPASRRGPGLRGLTAGLSLLAMSLGASAQVFISGVGSYAYAPLSTLDMTMLGNMHSRLGDSSATTSTAQSPDDQRRNAWARGVYVDWELEPFFAGSKGHAGGVQVGTDVWANRNWRLGVYAGYLGSSLGGSAFFDNDARSRYLGYYTTWTDGAGLYVDGVLQGARHRYGWSGEADSIAASIEVGKSFALSNSWSIEPQAQLVYQRAAVGNTVTDIDWARDSEGGYVGRLGARIRGDFATGAGRLQPYASVNLYRNTSGSQVAASTAGPFPLRNTSGYSDAEAAVGATLALTPAVALYGELGHRWNVDGNDGVVKSSTQGSLGVKLQW